MQSQRESPESSRVCHNSSYLYNRKMILRSDLSLFFPDGRSQKRAALRQPQRM